MREKEEKGKGGSEIGREQRGTEREIACGRGENAGRVKEICRDERERGKALKSKKESFCTLTHLSFSLQDGSPHHYVLPSPSFS